MLVKTSEAAPPELANVLNNLFQFRGSEIFLDVKLLAGLTVKAGTKIELPATVTGKPEPKITWTGDMLLKQDKRITIENVPKKSTVTIMDSKRSDTGTYIIEGCERLWAGHRRGGSPTS